jgi:hypothetical protein
MPSLRANEAIQREAGKLDRFVASAPLRKRFAFVAGNDVTAEPVTTRTSE